MAPLALIAPCHNTQKCSSFWFSNKQKILNFEITCIWYFCKISVKISTKKKKRKSKLFCWIPFRSGVYFYIRTRKRTKTITSTSLFIKGMVLHVWILDWLACMEVDLQWRRLLRRIWPSVLNKKENKKKPKKSGKST